MTDRRDGMPLSEHWPVPDAIVICATCGHGAWRDGYPCNRCGGLDERRYVPEPPRGAVDPSEGSREFWATEFQKEVARAEALECEVEALRDEVASLRNGRGRLACC